MEVIGAGSVVQRDKSKTRARCRDWELSVLVDADGRRKRRTRAFHGTYTQAAAALREFVDELGEARAASDMTLGEYMDLWHAKREASGTFAYKTMKNERIRMNAIRKALGNMKLRELDAERVASVYAQWRTHYARGTVNIMHETMDTMLNDAVRSGLVPSNPCKGIKMQYSRAKERNVLSDGQIDSLMSALDPSDPWQFGVFLCLCFGLRRGEAVALRWRDWDGMCIHVERADAGDGTDKPPKTPAGIRSVPAPSSVAPVLDELRGSPDSHMLEVNGRRMNAASLGSWWYHHRADYGVSCTLHELRHSYLTRLARAGVHPRVMMRLAGHDTIAVCMEIYTHVSDDMQKDAVTAAFG